MTYQNRQEYLKLRIDELSIDNLWVHADSFRTLGYVTDDLNHLIPDKHDFAPALEKHVSFLTALKPSANIVIPSFSYQFPQTKEFNIDSKSEVGALSEYFRCHYADYRTRDPMFSACGTGDNPLIQSVSTCPFDNKSIFAHLVQNKGYILFYGASFLNTTLIHHAEYLSKVQYRYWKTVQGQVIDGDQKYPITWRSHFRPMGKYLDYDWGRLKVDLEQMGILHVFDQVVMGLDAKQLAEFWQAKMADDHLYLLDEKSRLWVKPKLEELGRSFLAEDFE